jgi:hypothetical protein
MKNNIVMGIFSVQKHSSYLVVLLLFVSFASFSQNKKDDKANDQPKEESKWDKLVFGGNIGLQFGTKTYIEISPNAGYYFYPKLMTGMGLTYQYYQDRGFVKSPGVSIFGGRLYSEYTFVDNIGQSLRSKANYGIFGHIEYEALSLDRDFSKTTNVNRFWLHGLLIGGGIKQTFGKHSSFNLTLLYNLFANNRTPYVNPIIRIGFYL